MKRSGGAGFIRSLAAVCVAVLGGCGTETPVATSSTGDAIVKGVATGANLANVGQVVGRASPEADWVSLCSGTLIAPNAFLSAAHCPWAAEVALGLVETGVHFDPTLTPETKVITRGHWVQHPQYVNAAVPPPPVPSPTNPVDTFDLAVFVLDEPLDLPVASLPELGELASLPGADDGGPALVTTAGYGMKWGGAPQTAGRRRITTGRVVDVFDAWLLLEPDPGTICGYDSGGPTFLGDADRGGGSALSRVDATTTWGNCSSWSMMYRLDTPAARGFLEQYLPAP